MRLDWDLGLRPYDLGVDRGVLYLSDGAVAWNGLVSVQESPTAAAGETKYFDGRLVDIATDSDDYKAAISAYTYPGVFAEYNGYGPHETYSRFGMSYRTEHGDDYRLHLVYNALITPSDRSWGTNAAQIDISTFSWDVTSSVEPVSGARPSEHLILDSTELSWVVRLVEDVLYGTDRTEPRLPNAAELIEIYENAAIFKVRYNNDGTYTVTGEDEVVQVLPNGEFRLIAPTVANFPKGLFSVSSHA